MPNRVLRDWTNSERFDELSIDAEVFFTRLIMKADDFGGFYGNTKLLKSHLFPLKEFSHKKIEKWIVECSDIGIINYYQIDDKKYIRINGFGQRTRIMKSKFPDPPSNDCQMSDVRPLETKPNQTETELETETYIPPTPKGESVVYEDLIKFFNETFKKQSRLINDTVKGKYKAREKEGYTFEDFKKAMVNASKTKFHIESNYNHCTLEFFSRQDKLDKYLNAKSDGKNQRNTSGNHSAATGFRNEDEVYDYK